MTEFLFVYQFELRSYEKGMSGQNQPKLKISCKIWPDSIRAWCCDSKHVFKREGMQRKREKEIVKKHEKETYRLFPAAKQKTIKSESTS